MQTLKKIVVLGFMSIMVACSLPEYADVNSVYKTNQENIMNDDTNLAHKIEDKIKHTYPDAKVQVWANHFNVLVVGEVTTSAVRDWITNYAKSIEGVKKVYNYVTISAFPELKVNTDLTDKAKLRLAQEKNIYAKNVLVEIVGTTAYVMGTDIGNLTYFERALRGIAVMDGVDKIVNLTTVGKDDYRSKEDNNF